MLTKGVIADVVTPFSGNGEMDFDMLRTEARLLDNSAVNGLCVGGMLSGMEGTLPEELGAVTAAVRSQTNKSLFAMVCPDTTMEAQEMIRAVVDAGADAVFVAQPHYLSLPTEEGLVEMFADLKKTNSCPLLLADCFLNGMVGLQVTRTLIGKSLIDGVLQGADAHVLVDLLYVQKEVPVYSGVEDLQYLAYMLGAQGVISDLATVFPVESGELYRAFAAGKHSEARIRHERLVRLWRALGRGPETEGRIRAAIAAQGRNVGPAPSPYNQIPATASGEIQTAIGHEGLQLA